MNNIDTKLRKLALTNYWQTIFRTSKECSGIHLFDNISNFSGLQSRFLYWLIVYDMLYEELMKHEDNFLTQKVIVDFDRCDAYIAYRNKKHDYLWQKYRREEKEAEVRTMNKHTTDGKLTVFNVDLRSE